MKARWKWGLLGGIAAVGLAAGFAVAWVLWGPFSFQSAEAKVKEEATLLNGRDRQRMLAEASRFYWGHNLPLAAPPQPALPHRYAKATPQINLDSWAG